MPQYDDDEDGDVKVVDCNGTALKDGDSVTLIKDLKVKGLVLKTEFIKKAS